MLKQQNNKIYRKTCIYFDFFLHHYCHDHHRDEKTVVIYVFFLYNFLYIQFLRPLISSKHTSAIICIYLHFYLYIGYRVCIMLCFTNVYTSLCFHMFLGVLKCTQVCTQLPRYGVEPTHSCFSPKRATPKLYNESLELYTGSLWRNLGHLRSNPCLTGRSLWGWIISFEIFLFENFITVR